MMNATTTNGATMNATNGPRGRTRERADESGFTVAEILVTIVLTAIVTAAAVGIFLGQSAFYQKQDDAVFAEQTIRAGMDLAYTELRMSSPEDLLAAEPDSVAVRFDVRQALVCDSDATLETATLFVYDRVPSANVGGSLGTAVSGPYQDSFVYADGWTGAVLETGDGPAATCAAAGAPSMTPTDVYYRVVSFDGHPAGTPSPGSVVRVYGPLTYHFSPATVGDGTALYRSGMELGALLEEGARFRYVMDDGSVRDQVSGADLASVRKVRVEATALGTPNGRYEIAREARWEVALRN